MFYHYYSPSESVFSFSSSLQGLAQKYRRFMIYVHAKGMIVDDEYVLMGSVNINQRSLDVSRDTEIAMGAYQPTYTWSGKKTHPHSQVAFISIFFFFFWFHIVSKTFAFISRYSSSVIWIQVYGYRMSLLAEHLGVLEDCFCQPETLECMRKVNSIAKTN